MTIEFVEADHGDLAAIIALLKDDPLGMNRETDNLVKYQEAFSEICEDPNHTVVVGRKQNAVVACLQLTTLPCLTHGGRRRAQIEGVRVSTSMRGHGIGRQLIAWAIGLATERGCGVIQLTTDQQRPEALHFYEGLGFENTHHGLKQALDDGNKN